MARAITLTEHLRRAGSVKTAAKAKASRKNGLAGGRPAKFAEGDRARANMKAPIAYRGRTCTITKIYPGRSECAVFFDDGGEAERAARLMSWYLDKV